MLPFLEKAVDLTRSHPTEHPAARRSVRRARLTKPSGFGLADESLRPNWLGGDFFLSLSLAKPHFERLPVGGSLMPPRGAHIFPCP